jgi:hypothetical protein
MLTNVRKPEIEFGKIMLVPKPIIPTINPIVIPTIGERKKYLDIASIDSIPNGIIVKKPNKPFKPLVNNWNTFGVDFFLKKLFPLLLF